MNNTPKCPGCGREMVPREDFHKFFFVCLDCGWKSPYGQNEKEGLDLALKRVVPKNRVLTLDEIREMQDNNQCNWVLIWVESQSEINTKEYCLVQGCIQYIVDNEFSFVYPDWEGNDLFKAEVYKKTWRCWLRRPTEKERETVLWEK